MTSTRSAPKPEEAWHAARLIPTTGIGGAQEQEERATSSLLAVMHAVPERPRYQDRSYRYGLLEAGHIGENAYLAATSMGLGACGVGAFMDDAINEMLGVDGLEEAALYMLAVGRLA